MTEQPKQTTQPKQGLGFVSLAVVFACLVITVHGVGWIGLAAIVSAYIATRIGLYNFLLCLIRKRTSWPAFILSCLVFLYFALLVWR